MILFLWKKKNLYPEAHCVLVYTSWGAEAFICHRLELGRGSLFCRSTVGKFTLTEFPYQYFSLCKFMYKNVTRLGLEKRLWNYFDGINFLVLLATIGLSNLLTLLSRLLWWDYFDDLSRLLNFTPRQKELITESVGFGWVRFDIAVQVRSLDKKKCLWLLMRKVVDDNTSLHEMIFGAW
jgi:hypothetical protein